MTYARAFFDIQLAFARKAARLTGQSIERGLLAYTNLYIRFGLGRDLDPDHVSWRAYLDGLSRCDDVGEWTYQFYLKSVATAISHPIVATFGCFSYALRGDDSIKLHFRNAETEMCSPLTVGRVEQRRAELQALLRDVFEDPNPPQTVVGASWLYNLDAYRRLFPPSYLASARPIGPHFQRMSLWGQLLDRFGNTKDPMTRVFIKRVHQASTVTELNECFPLPTLMVEARLSAFRDVYHLEPPFTLA
jgi:hypothetical protein